MEREPNLVISSISQRIVEDGVPFKVDIYKLEGGDSWSLEVVTEDGTSIVWDNLFEDDRAAFEEAISTIRSEGAVAFANGGSNVVPFSGRRTAHCRLWHDELMLPQRSTTADIRGATHCCFW
ncbi:hypothetical protein [Yoonia vestfoldensis]|uniref:hypothetical protein n=1 Tax=Yoonia vestfoldensis TaxID=245188 RepID=UPI00036F17C2|nr:hypothetical protein [Yoonia vestfoldensis]